MVDVCSDGGDDDEEVRNISDAVEEIRRYPRQALVGEFASGEDVNHVRWLKKQNKKQSGWMELEIVVRRIHQYGCGYYLLGARNGDVDNSGSLFQLEVSNESLAEVVRLLQDVHGIASARKRQEDAVLLIHLDLASDPFELLLFEPHPLSDAQW